MRSTILPLPRGRRPVAAAAVAALAAALVAWPLAATRAGAHEIPSRVTALAFVKAEGDRLRVVLRVPLESVGDVHWPQRELGYVDLARAAPMARAAAETWVAPFLEVWENGDRLAQPHVVATRIALPADRAFAAYESALAGATGAALPHETELPWQQAALDVVLEVPIASAASSFAVRPRFERLGVRTTTVLRYVTPDGAERAYQYVGDPGVVRLDPRWHHAALQFVRLGVAHILGGLDHLLFVLCLVIPIRRLRPLVLVVTSFTVAHSITLASAALGVVPDALWFPPLVETLIAASIVYMALENILGARVQRRWLVAFGFGLVHGFGFSFALRESLQFAGPHLAVSLFTFNVGVELGQLLVLAAAVPLLAAAFRRGVPERAGVIVLSALVAHTAWHWMLERGTSLRGYAFTPPALDLAFAASAARAALVLAISGAAAWAIAEASRRWLRPAADPALPAPSTASQS